MMMTRKAFQELQVSSVTSKSSFKMGGEGGNVIKESASVNKSAKCKKPNTVSAKQPKRKNVGSENKPKKTSKEVVKKTASKAKGQKKENLQEFDLQRTVILNQSRLESYLCPTSSTSVISDDSAVQDLGNITYLSPSRQLAHKASIAGNITVRKSVAEELLLITSETPTQAYWQQIAEQRHIALEKAVVENEMLLDEINVLQAENMQLKNALEAADELFKKVGLLD